MDPFSAEGELINIHTAFHQAQYQAVVDFDDTSFSESNKLPARVLKLRSKIQLGQAAAVLSEVNKEAKDNVDLKAVQILAQHAKEPTSDAPKEAALALSKSDTDNLTVQLCCGIVLANTGLREEAITLLKSHQGSLDAVALITQIHLASNRLDLARAEVSKARSWAQDSLVFNLAESWVGLREGGEKYQAAFYVFEELATGQATSSPSSVLSQAISELHLGRLPEAEVALSTALEQAPKDADVLANAIVLNTILGKTEEVEKLSKQLEAVDKDHPLLTELVKKQESFDTAMAKYQPKFEPVAS